MSANKAFDRSIIGATLVGQRRYRIISWLGAGGMGVTYRAWCEQAGIPVVVKMPKKILLEDPKFAARFYREIELLQKLHHPHIVPIVDVGMHDRLPFVVMRFLPGGSLSHRRLRGERRRLRPNPASSLHRWLPAIADALDHVHAHGIVHRDVKPANIFFDAFWGSYLGDFGIAKVVEESEEFEKELTLTATHMGIGTQQYMAPEQFTPKAVIDGKADQYALAVTVYEILTGVRPFTGAAAHLIVEVLTHEVPPLQLHRPDLPEALVEAVHRGLGKKPADRFATCRDFASAVLDQVAAKDEEPGVARLLCPGCSGILKLTADAAGRLGSCPRCEAGLIVAPDLGSLWLKDEGIGPQSWRKRRSRKRRWRFAGMRGVLRRMRLRVPRLPATPVASQQSSGSVEVIDRRSERVVRSDGHRSRRAEVGVVAFTAALMAAVCMALGVVERPIKKRRPFIMITSSAPEVDEHFEEFEEEEPLENVEQTEVTDSVVPTDVTVVEDVQIIAQGDDADLAPPPLGRPDLEWEIALAVDTRTRGGTIGATAGGFGGRANAAARARTFGGGGDTEEAVDRALKWLTEHQLNDGSWSFDMTECPKCKGRCSHSGDSKDRAGATALALLPFLGRGYTHREGPYKRQIERGVAFLAGRVVAAHGKAHDQAGTMYSQGLAGIVLSECYGMTQDNRLARPAQMAIDYIMAAQDQRGGGWRYQSGQPGDTSASGWQIMALESGYMAYLQVNPLTIRKVVNFLNSVQSDFGATYGYTDNANPTPARSAAGLLCRMYLGWKRDNPALQDGAARLAKQGPTGDLYYDYYATQVMYHMEGEMWLAWNGKMKRLLLKAQSMANHESGSWYEGFDGAEAGLVPRVAGRLGCTALATLILEVYYRHLPLYANYGKEEEFKE